MTMSATLKRIGAGIVMLPEIIERIPQLAHLSRTGIIQRVIIVADNRGPAKIRATFIPKQMDDQHALGNS